MAQTGVVSGASDAKAGANVRFDAGQIAAIVGVGSAFFLFLAAIFTWSFGQGLISFFGFPDQVISLKTAVDAFPNVAVENVGGFGVVLFGGFVLGRIGETFFGAAVNRKPLALYVRLTICGGVASLTMIPVIIFMRHKTPSTVWSVLLFSASYISTFFIGYGYRMFNREERVRFFILGLFFLQCIEFNLISRLSG